MCPTEKDSVPVGSDSAETSLRESESSRRSSPSLRVVNGSGGSCLSVGFFGPHFRSKTPSLRLIAGGKTSGT